jgi:hypothetical protein
MSGLNRRGPLQRLVAIKQDWENHSRRAVDRYAALMTQVEALRVEVSALEVEIRRTEGSDMPPAQKNARVRGLASRASESYGHMLSLMRQAAEIYPAVLTRPLDIPHTFSRRDRERLIDLPERPPSLSRREIGRMILVALAVVLVLFLLGRLLLVPLPPTH